MLKCEVSMKIEVLDCTLRDGGYVNDWTFGEKNINIILNNLQLSNVDIIECGYLTNKRKYYKNSTQFNTIKEINSFIPLINDNTYVCMVNYGDYNLSDIPVFCGKGIKGIRIAFHKKNLREAIKFAAEIKNKGYEIYIQPMITMSYSDEEFLDLIRQTNEIAPTAFYIVDSFGVMNEKDLIRLYYLVEHNLNNKIKIGYHSHNNMQLAYSNAQTLVNINRNRDLIIDASVFGMGRGAGNLNTELFMEHINMYFGGKYSVYPLLSIVDNVLSRIYEKNPWGYSLPHYLSAVNNCHPNYATYLSQKNALSVESMNSILSQIKDEKKISFNQSYIESLYTKIQSRAIDDVEVIKELKGIFVDRDILVIAPGKSILKEYEKIRKYIEQNNCICISVNFVPENLKCDYVFISNEKRIKELNNIGGIKKIYTSNIANIQGDIVVNYNNLINNEADVRDNSALMLLQLMIDCGIELINIAGLDGYDYCDNYYNDDMEWTQRVNNYIEKNISMSKALRQFRTHITMNFITDTKYEI